MNPRPLLAPLRAVAGGARAAIGRLAAAAHAVASRFAYADVLELLGLDGSEVDRRFLVEVPGLTMRFLTPQEISAFAARQNDTDLGLAYVADALRRGDRCFAILDGERLASYSWYAVQATGVTKELALHFPRPHIYMHHSFTTETYRGRRLHTIGIVRAIAALEADGPVSLLAIVSATNAASLKSCGRAGYRPLGRFWLLGGVNRLGLYTSPSARLAGCHLAPRRTGFGFLQLPAAAR